MKVNFIEGESMKNVTVTMTAIIIGLSLSHIAKAALANGDEKCGADGSILRYDADTQSWRRTVAPCAPDPTQRGDENATPGEKPANGDEKCGPDGFVLRYDADMQRWRQTISRCE